MYTTRNGVDAPILEPLQEGKWRLPEIASILGLSSLKTAQPLQYAREPSLVIHLQTVARGFQWAGSRGVASGTSAGRRRRPLLRHT